MLFVVGDRVVIAVPAVTDDSEPIVAGAKGMVVGLQGREGVVVAWDQTGYSLIRRAHLRIVNRVKATQPGTPAPSPSQRTGRGAGTAGGGSSKR